MTDRWLLALDGSTDVCSAALLQAVDEGGPLLSWRVASRRDDPDGRAQARVLLGLVHDMLGEVGGEASSLSAVVVGTGPGTFTGVRITVATARALAMSLSIPVLGVSTLSGLAAGAAEAAVAAAGTAPIPDVLVPVVDARRKQVFYGLYVRSDEGVWTRTRDFEACDRETFAGQLAVEAQACGVSEGAAIQVVGAADQLVPGLEPVFLRRSMRAEWLVKGQEFLDEPGALPQGEGVASWLSDRLRSGHDHLTVDEAARDARHTGAPETVKPIYVRPPDADLHITKMKDPWASKSQGEA